MNWTKLRVGLGIFLFAGLLLSGCSDEKEVIPPPVEPEPEVPVDPDEPGGEDEEEEIIPAHNSIIGSLCGFEGSLRRGEAYTDTPDKPTTYYNVPLFEATPKGSETGWWDNLVEEISYSGIDFIMMNCRGQQPSYPEKNVDHGDPTLLINMVEAMKRRGVENDFKIAFFDDCPATWEAARNEDLGRGYAGENLAEGRLPFPLKDVEPGTKAFQDSVFQYIWDYNLRLAFRSVPEEYLFKIDGRPLVFFWSVYFLGYDSDDYVDGKLVYILEQVRAKCMEEFGMDPMIVIDQDWLKHDRQLQQASPMDGVNDWFNMDVPYTVRTWKDLTVGIGVPGFLVNDRQPSGKMFLDANHGELLKEALRYCVGRNSDIILLEGFTDVLENAAYWRSTDETYYDFPNQRLNILRKWGSDPYPERLRVEAEACDDYYDRTDGNSGQQYRPIGDLDVAKCDDADGGWGWCVSNALTDEWLSWVELPFRAGQSTIKLRYSSRESADAQVRFTIGGQQCAVVQLPATGGRWVEVDAATVTFEKNGWHEVKLDIVQGGSGLSLNNFTIIAAE